MSHYGSTTFAPQPAQPERVLTGTIMDYNVNQSMAGPSAESVIPNFDNLHIAEGVTAPRTPDLGERIGSGLAVARNLGKHALAGAKEWAKEHVTPRRVVMTTLGAIAATAASKMGIDLVHAVSAIGQEMRHTTDSIAQLEQITPEPSVGSGELLTSATLYGLGALASTAAILGIGTNRTAEAQHRSSTWNMTFRRAKAHYPARHAAPAATNGVLHTVRQTVSSKFGQGPHHITPAAA